MVRVIEHFVWQEKYEKKDSRNRVIERGFAWKGKIKVDPSGKSDSDIEKEVEKVNAKFKVAFSDACKELGVEPYELPRQKVAELQQGLAEDLRRAYGKDPSNGNPLKALKEYDIIKLARQFEIEPGTPGWEEDIVRMVRDDKHLIGDEEDGN